jgi:hypothetical protein
MKQEDPTHAQAIASQTASQTPFSAAGSEDWVDVSILNQSYASVYTSSIEMYTTPETYPLWQTRRPVVVVLNKSKGVYHHYYRYLVVTPGAQGEDRTNDMEEDDGYSDTESEKGVNPQLATTSNEYSGTSQVMLWEDPFEQFTGNNLFNLPYRTVDIDMLTNEAQDQDRIDLWNGKEDPSFQAYLIRESVRNLRTRREVFSLLHKLTLSMNPWTED